MTEQLSLFVTTEEPPQRDCNHAKRVKLREPWAGWKPGEMKQHCADCWHWLDDNGNAPALGEC